MASPNGSWTMAGAKKNKPQNSRAMSKGKKKAIVENMPRIEPNPPVQESPTIYSVFLQENEKEGKSEKDQQPAVMLSTSASASSVVYGPNKKNVQLNKKTLEKKKDKQYTLEDALQQITVADLGAVLTKDQQMFPDNPDIWLKDLASFINLQLANCYVPVSDTVFEGKPPDYPLCLLSKSQRTFLTNSISKHSADSLQSFLDHCINSQMNDTAKGLMTYGFHIYIQLVLRTKPEITLSRLPHYVSLLKNNISRTASALCILWTVAQAGFTSLPAGLAVWLDLMLPVLNIHGLSAFCIHFIETLLRRYPDSCDEVSAVLPKREFFMLFDELFSTQPKLSTDLHTRLLHVYPRLKVIAFGSRPEAMLHSYFTSFLSRLTPTCHGAKKTELLTCLMSCLVVDRQSLSTWRQVYIKHLPQSSILLSHLAEDVDGVTRQLDRQLLRETVRAFTLTNDDLTGGAGVSETAADMQLACHSCQLLLDDLSRVHVPSQWFSVLLLVALIICIALAADVYMSPTGIAGCHTYRALNAVGLIQLGHHVYSRVSFYTAETCSWLLETTPVYWSKSVEIVRPYASLVRVHVLNVLDILYRTARPLLDFCHLYMTQLFAAMLSNLPLLLSSLTYCVSSVGYVIVQLYHHILLYAGIFINWLLTHLLVGSWSPANIQQSLTSLAVTFQSCVIQAYRWLLQYLVYV